MRYLYLLLVLLSGFASALTVSKASIKAYERGFMIQVPLIYLLIKMEKLSGFTDNLAPFADPGL